MVGPWLGSIVVVVWLGNSVVASWSGNCVNGRWLDNSVFVFGQTTTWFSLVRQQCGCLWSDNNVVLLG